MQNQQNRRDFYLLCGKVELLSQQLFCNVPLKPSIIVLYNKYHMLIGGHNFYLFIHLFDFEIPKQTCLLKNLWTKLTEWLFWLKQLLK